MDKFVFDDALLPVSSDPQVALSEEVFGVYRQLAKAREATSQQLDGARQEAEGMYRTLRRRLADLGAEVFHLRRCVVTLREPMAATGLTKELHRLELLVKRFDQALQQNGVQVESLEGREIEKLAEVVEVVGHVLADVHSACVHETIDPLVLVDGQVLRFAKVISAAPIQPSE